ncbi:hypothetical protein DXG01_011431, partial [Tephrocybe rancida]
RADFSAEVTAALRVTDGALVVVDCIYLCTDGKSIQTRVQLPPTPSDPHGWVVTLRQFAGRCAKEFGVDKERTMAKLWGDNFFDPTTRTWTTKSTDADGDPLDRGSSRYHELQNDLETICKKLGINLMPKKELEGQALLNVIMRKSLPFGDALLQMIVNLPSSASAQAYCIEILYEGPMDDESAVSIRNCDSSCPLVLYDSKIVPSSDKGRSMYLDVSSLAPSVPAKEFVYKAPSTLLAGGVTSSSRRYNETVLRMMPRSFEPIEVCPAGNIVGLAGSDQLLLKNNTITSSDTTHNTRMMGFSVTLSVQTSVDVDDPPPTCPSSLKSEAP